MSVIATVAYGAERPVYANRSENLCVKISSAVLYE